MKKANLILGGGVALLVIGLIVIGLMARSDDGDDQPRTQQTVLVAKGAIAAGESGRDVLNDGRAAVQTMNASDVPAGALAEEGRLNGVIFTGDIKSGQPILSTQVRVTSLGQGSIKIPEGKQAVALSLDFTAAGAGYVSPGSRVNVYSNIAPNSPGATKHPYTRMLLTNIEVLDVSAETMPRRADSSEQAAAAPAPTKLTVLLAVDARQAEATIFAANQNQIWLTVVPEGQGASETGGVDYETNYLDAPGLERAGSAEPTP